jgi:hypothetical protein
VCNGFEAEWCAGNRPRIEDALAGAPDLIPHGLLCELLATEVELRLVDGERPDPTEYRRRFPGYDAAVAHAFNQAGATVEPPSPEEVKDPSVSPCGGSDREPADPSSISSGVLARLRCWDAGAWRTMIALYGPEVYRWCRRAGLGPEEAADVGQEVFLAVATK